MLKNYLSVTKKEWNGLLVLIALIVIVWLVPPVYQHFKPEMRLNLKGFDKKVALLNQKPTDTAATKNIKLFAFNPNHLPDTAWQQLGLTERQINIIKNYEAKGGRFYSKGDLKKIYTISADDYKRLAPYINLPDRDNYKVQPLTIVELNTADSAKLTALRGIGPGFAKIILRYRDRLGGFYKKEQLKEIYNLDSITYADIAPQLRVDAGKIVKIDLNKATTNSLLVFPYLTYKQKNAIVEYRNQHGNYNTLADLKNIPIIDDATIKKIEPYISLK